MNTFLLAIPSPAASARATLRVVAVCCVVWTSMWSIHTMSGDAL
jgi:hypothetical protein